jgi:hypothetical protein
VHIHFCGNGRLWFRFYSESLGKAPSNQALLPLSIGASPRLGMPSLRSCSVGPPPSAIHGRGRLTRHPCRVAHCAEPPLGLSRGRAPQKAKRGGLPAGLFPQRLRVLIVDRSHAPRGNAAGDAPRSAVDARLESCAGGTRSVTGCIPTQSVGTISGCRELLIWLWLWLLILICLPLSQRPNAGVAQGAPRQGCRGSRPRPWMADGGGPPGAMPE